MLSLDDARPMLNFQPISLRGAGWRQGGVVGLQSRAVKPSWGRKSQEVGAPGLVGLPQRVSCDDSCRNHPWQGLALQKVFIKLFEMLTPLAKTDGKGLGLLVI